MTILMRTNKTMILLALLDASNHSGCFLSAATDPSTETVPVRLYSQIMDISKVARTPWMCSVSTTIDFSILEEH